jgi:hypothetical protein
MRATLDDASLWAALMRAFGMRTLCAQRDRKTVTVTFRSDIEAELFHRALVSRHLHPWARPL